ncbi:MAG: helix-turn-helix domain-containing protein [Pseudomonadota bacterium]
MTFDWRTALLLLLVAPLLPIMAALSVRSAEKRAAMFFCAWLLCWVLLTTPSIIGFAGAYQNFPWLTFAPFDTELWLGPLLYLYTLSLTRRDMPSRWWLWLLPGAAQTTYYTLCFVTLGDPQSKFAYARAFHEPFVIPVESVVAVVLGIVGVTMSWQETRRYRAWLSHSHSSMREFDLTSLRRFLVIMVGLVGLWSVVEVLQLVIGRFSYTGVAIVLMCAGLAIFWLAIDLLTQADRVYPKMSVVPEKIDADANRSAASKWSVETLRDAVRRGGWHRDAGLTIRGLARHLATNESTLSSAINAVPDLNFNAFINRLRLEEVCEQLLDPGDPRSVLEIALDGGFGSKATFNRTFKDQIGMTPSQWKRRGQTSQIPDMLGFPET